MTRKNLLIGDCRTQLATIDSNSVDSIVTDPPYELGFMGKKWDASGVAYDLTLWSECLRVLKPGGHLLAFGGTRTYHRMAVAIEDAGFEIRDSLHWTYGTGFPKSHNVSKALDKLAGAKRKVVGTSTGTRAVGGVDGSNAWRTGAVQENVQIDVTAAATDAAKQWDGWGTALKPSHEPIVMARKPITQTVAKNVLEHGTGALNIDACRVGTETRTTQWSGTENYKVSNPKKGETTATGRWPANTILTHAPDCDTTCTDSCPVNQLNQQTGTLTSGMMKAGTPTKGGQGNALGHFNPGATTKDTYADSGGASRFFTVTDWDHTIYCPKPSKKERNAGLDGLPIDRPDKRTDTGKGTFTEKGVQPQQNHHPTVKPVELMRHLIRLVTPPGGVVLDPFLGSGTTAVAATLEGFNWIGCELTDEYLPIIEARIKWAENIWQPPTSAESD